MWRTRERRTPDMTVEEDEISGGGVFVLGRQRALVDGAAVRDEPLLTRLHISL